MQSQFFKAPSQPTSATEDKCFLLLSTALHMDMMHDDAAARLHTWLAEDKERLTTRTKEQMTLLHLAAIRGKGGEIWQKYLLITRLLEQGADPSAVDENQTLPLFHALQNYDVAAPTYEKMLRKLADVKVDDAIFLKNIDNATRKIAAQQSENARETSEKIAKLQFCFQLVAERKTITNEAQRTSLLKQISKTMAYVAMRENNIHLLLMSLLDWNQRGEYEERINQIKLKHSADQFIAILVAAQNKFGREKVQAIFLKLLQQEDDEDLQFKFEIEIEVLYTKEKITRESKEELAQRPLQAIIDDFKNRKHPLDDKSIEQLELEYKLITTHPDLVGCTMDELITKLKKCKESLVDYNNDPDARGEALAIFREIIFRLYGIPINATQMLNILAMLTGPDKRLGEIKTGEGKSLIIATLAAYCAFMFAEKIDIYTSSADLAVRDMENFEPLFKLLGLTVMHNVRGKDKAEIPVAAGVDIGNAGIVFGRLDDFASDYIDFEVGEERHVRKFDRAIGDEFDALIRKPSLYIGYHDPLCFPEFVQEVKAFMESDAVKNTENFAHHIQQKLQLHYPADYLQEWITAWLRLDRYREGREYVVQNGKIVPVNYEDSGELQHSMRLYKTNCLLELKHGLQVHDDALTYLLLSPAELLKKYKRLNGLTGTLGGKLHREKMCEVLQINSSSPQTVCYDSPPHLPSQLQPDPKGHIVVEPGGNYLETLFSSIFEAVNEGRPVLVICKTIAEANVIHDLLKRMHKQVYLYHDMQTELPDDIALQAGKPGAVTIGTALLGRGFNIPVSAETSAKGGMKTILTSLDADETDELQKAGRGARQGKKGTYQFIVHRVDLDKMGIASLEELEKRRMEITSTLNPAEIYRSQIQSLHMMAQRLFFALPLEVKLGLSDVWKRTTRRILDIAKKTFAEKQDKIHFQAAEFAVCQEIKKFWVENHIDEIDKKYLSPRLVAEALGSADLIAMLARYDEVSLPADEAKKASEKPKRVVLDFDLTLTTIHTNGIALSNDPKELLFNFKEPEKLAAFFKSLNAEDIAVAIASFGTEIEFVDSLSGIPYKPLFASGRASIEKHLQALLGDESKTIVDKIAAFNVKEKKCIHKMTYSVTPSQYATLYHLIQKLREDLSVIHSKQLGDEHDRRLVTQSYYDKVHEMLATLTMKPTCKDSAVLPYGKLPHLADILQGEDARRCVFADDDITNTELARAAGCRVIENISVLDKLRWVEKLKKSFLHMRRPADKPRDDVVMRV